MLGVTVRKPICFAWYCSNQLFRPFTRLQHEQTDDAFAQLHAVADDEQGDDGEIGEAGEEQSRGDADSPDVGGVKKEGDEDAKKGISPGIL